MWPLPLLFLTIFVKLTVQDYGFGMLQVVSDLLPEDCFKDNLNYHEENQKTGLPYCDKTFSSKSPCPIYHRGTTQGQWAVVYKPTCTKDSLFAPKQCKGEVTTGRCFCHDKSGMRIFGQQWWSQAANMTCACSRRKSDMSDSSAGNYVFFNSLHCNSMGNYESLQCDILSQQCWCADEQTGDLLSPVVPQAAMEKLPCYSSLTVGTQYLRQCENQKYAMLKIVNQLSLRGTRASYGEFVCDEDGAYGPYTIIDGSAYCTWRDNSKIGTWQYGESDRSILNCNCARDTRIFSDAGKKQNQNCNGYGNYEAYQGSGSSAYCVDTSGYKKSNTEVLSKDDCANFFAYDEPKP